MAFEEVADALPHKVLVAKQLEGENLPETRDNVSDVDVKVSVVSKLVLPRAGACVVSIPATAFASAFPSITWRDTMRRVRCARDARNRYDPAFRVCRRKFGQRAGGDRFLASVLQACVAPRESKFIVIGLGASQAGCEVIHYRTANVLSLRAHPGISSYATCALTVFLRKATIAKSLTANQRNSSRRPSGGFCEAASPSRRGPGNLGAGNCKVPRRSTRDTPRPQRRVSY